MEHCVPVSGGALFKNLHGMRENEVCACGSCTSKDEIGIPFFFSSVLNVSREKKGNFMEEREREKGTQISANKKKENIYG